MNRRILDRRIQRRIQFWIFLASGGLVFTSFGYYLASITR